MLESIELEASDDSYTASLNLSCSNTRIGMVSNFIATRESNFHGLNILADPYSIQSLLKKYLYITLFVSLLACAIIAGCANPTSSARYYTISFNANGGSGTMTTLTIASEASTKLTVNDFTRTGYGFAGWASSSSGVVAYADGSVYLMGKASVTLFAVWSKNSYTITFDANGGTGTMANQTIAANTSSSLAFNAFHYLGYSYMGWNTQADGSGINCGDGGSFAMGTASIVLYAQWYDYDANWVPKIDTIDFSSGELTPSFLASQHVYYLNLDNNVDRVKMQITNIPNVKHSIRNVVNGIKLLSGDYSDDLLVSEGDPSDAFPNIFHTKVTDESNRDFGSAGEYFIYVHRKSMYEFKTKLDDISILQGVKAEIISPDYKYLYVAASNTHCIATFNLNRNADILQLENKNTENGLQYDDLCLSRNGDTLYALSGSMINIFSRNASTGTITYIDNSSTPQDRAIWGSGKMRISPDNRFIYISGINSSSLAWFSIDQSNGLLKYEGSYGGYLQNTPELDGVSSINISKDNRSLYVTLVANSNSISKFARNTDSGQITYDRGYGSGGLWWFDVAVSSNDEDVYAIGNSGDYGVIAWYKRNIDGDLTFMEEYSDSHAFGGGKSIAFSNDESKILFGGFEGLSWFKRDTSSGELIYSGRIRQNNYSGLGYMSGIGKIVTNNNNDAYVISWWGSEVGWYKNVSTEN